MKPPEKCTLDELKPYAAEYHRRIRLGKAGPPKVLRPCPKCGEPYGARELRQHIPQCDGQSKIIDPAR